LLPPGEKSGRGKGAAGKESTRWTERGGPFPCRGDRDGKKKTKMVLQKRNGRSSPFLRGERVAICWLQGGAGRGARTTHK